MQRAFDAVIVGAGPAGATAAILLARAGWSVALVEKQTFPRRKVCGECIAASNLPLLDTLGVGAAIEAAAGPDLHTVALMRGETCAVADLPPARHARWRWGRALGRETLDTLLRDQARAQGAVVLQPWSVDACERSGAAWRCTVRAIDGVAAAVLQAPVVIDAHGSWETLRAARRADAPAPAVRCAADLFAFKANFRATALPPGVLPVLSFEGGYGGMVVAADALATVACCVRRDRLATWRRAAPGLAAGEQVEAMLRAQCAGVRHVLDRAARAGPWLAAGPLLPGIRVRTDDEILRIGNAAGEAHPILGEGISMALQSAVLLVAQLVAEPPRGSLPHWRRASARAYAHTWRGAFVRRLRLAALFAHAAMGPKSGVALMALAQAYPWVLTAGARWGGKIESAADIGAIGAAT